MDETANRTRQRGFRTKSESLLQLCPDTIAQLYMIHGNEPLFGTMLPDSNGITDLGASMSVQTNIAFPIIVWHMITIRPL